MSKRNLNAGTAKDPNLMNPCTNLHIDNKGAVPQILRGLVTGTHQTHQNLGSPSPPFKVLYYLLTIYMWFLYTFSHPQITYNP